MKNKRRGLTEADAYQMATALYQLEGKELEDHMQRIQQRLSLSEDWYFELVSHLVETRHLRGPALAPSIPACSKEG